MRSGSTSRSIARRAGSGKCRVTEEPAAVVAALADEVRETMGAATAVTAEADRNARRVEPLRPRTSLFSMTRPKDETGRVSSYCADLVDLGLDRSGGEVARQESGCGPEVQRTLGEAGQHEAGVELPADLLGEPMAVVDRGFRPE